MILSKILLAFIDYYRELKGSKNCAMQKILTGIASHKMKSFTQVITPPRFDGNTVGSRHGRKGNAQLKPSIQHLRRIASSFILFDWEFFSNELEYE